MFERVLNIDDLEKDVQKFREDTEKAKAEYIGEYGEYLNIVTDFENVEKKYDFLQEEVGLITKVFPEGHLYKLPEKVSI